MHTDARLLDKVCSPGYKSSMARILYASFDKIPAPKGASQHIGALLEGLALAGHRVDLCAISQAEGFARTRVLPFPDGPGNFLERAGAFGEHVLAAARRERYDLWHVRGIWEGLPLALARGPGDPPLVYEVNGLPSIELPAHFPKLANQPALLGRLRRQEQALIEAADLLLTPSERTARCLGELGAPERKIRVVPNGVDLDRFEPSGPGAPEILYLGTFAPWQGLATLVRALRHVTPPWRLRLVGPPGKGWARQLDHLAGTLGVRDRLLIQPPLPPAMIPALIAGARVCVAPLDGSARNLIQGCCPLKLLEYMAAGKPIVASRVPPVEAMLTHGQEAWLVPPDDPVALATGLLRLLEDPALASRLGAAARLRASGLSWEASNRLVLAAYGELGVGAIAKYSAR